MLQVAEDRSTEAVEERLELEWIQLDEVLLVFAVDEPFLSQNVALRSIGNGQSCLGEIVHTETPAARDGSRLDHLLQIQMAEDDFEHFERDSLHFDRMAVSDRRPVIDESRMRNLMKMIQSVHFRKASVIRTAKIGIGICLQPIG